MTDDRFGDCGNVRALLNEYIDGELRGEQLETLERHVAGCEACRAELEELDAVKRLVAESALPSPGIAAGVMEQINSGRVRMQKSRRIFIPFGTLAALAAVLVFVALNRNVFNIFSDKTGMDSVSGTTDRTVYSGTDFDDRAAAAKESEAMNGIMALPEDAQLVPPLKSALPEKDGRQESAAGETQSTEAAAQGGDTTTEEFGDSFQIEMGMNALAQKIKEESGFSIATSRTYSVHLPEEYTVSMLLEGFEAQEDSGIYVLGVSDEQALKDRLDSMPDALYNSYAESPDSDRIAVIIIDG